jgi:hypothetical protein
MKKTSQKKTAQDTGAKKARKKYFPPGWDEKRVKEVIAYYDQQTEDEELAEYEAALEVNDQSIILVPTKMIPEIQRLIARRQ